MHELSIAQEILNIVKDEIGSGGLHRVRSVRLRIGKLTAIQADSLRFCFQALIEKSSLEAASLEITEVPLSLRCESCGYSFTPEDWTIACPGCQSTAVKTIAGQELEISAIEMEEEKLEVP